MFSIVLSIYFESYYEGMYLISDSYIPYRNVIVNACFFDKFYMQNSYKSDTAE